MQLTRRQAFLLILLGLMAVGFVDRTQPDLRLSIFYLVPVGSAAWFLGRRNGRIVAVLAGGLWLVETLRTDAYPAPYENAALRLGFYLAVASLLSAIRARSRQQAAVAELSSTSLAGGSADDLMRRAVEVVVANTGAERARILEVAPDGETFVVRAVNGWPDDLVGTIGPRKFGRSSIAIGGPGQILGILAADRARQGRLSGDDRRFLGVIASVLAQALLRRRLETEAQKERIRHVVEMNDQVVQGLSAALYALQIRNYSTAERSVEFTLDAARNMMRDLSAASSPGGGLSVGDLTRAQPAVVPLGEPQPRQAAPTVRGQKTTVVLADDTPTLRALVAGIFDSFAPGEFDIVAEAEDGAEAIRAVRDTTPDVILLDLAMPRMTGLEAIPEIRRVSPRTKIVVFSGFHPDQVNGDIDAAGADAHCEKGVPGERLVAVIRGVVPRRGALRAVAGDATSPETRIAP
jgi:CheY-like chemotaxis protein